MDYFIRLHREKKSGCLYQKRGWASRERRVVAPWQAASCLGAGQPGGEWGASGELETRRWRGERIAPNVRTWSPPSPPFLQALLQQGRFSRLGGGAGQQVLDDPVRVDALGFTLEGQDQPGRIVFMGRET